MSLHAEQLPQDSGLAVSAISNNRLVQPMHNTSIQSEVSSVETLRGFAGDESIYAILDATDAPAVPPKMVELGEQRAISLFRGTAQEDYSAFAPYLAKVDSALLDWIVATLWKEPWGIFVSSQRDLETLRVHFRKFLLVRLPDGEKWYFRYYDPRILRVYLTNCVPLELQQFFGPVQWFGVANQAEERVLLIRALATGDRTQTVSPALPWQIRPEQHRAFQQTARTDFQDRMIAHLTNFFPDQCSALGDLELRKVVQYGVERAAHYQIANEKDVSKYLVLMFVFGRDFHIDPKIPWAHDILNDASLSDSRAKMAQLYTTAKLRLRRAEHVEG